MYYQIQNVILMQSRSKNNSIKTRTASKKMRQTNEKTAKNGYIFVAICQKQFSRSKIHSLNAAQKQKFLSLRKN